MLRNKAVRAYLLLVGLPLLLLLFVLRTGSSLTAPAWTAAQQKAAVAAAPAPMNLFLLVLQVAVVLGVSRIAGILFRKIGQPQVVGEMVAGILLGPSLLGWMAPELSKFIFPAASLGYLNALSQIGLVIFMFLVGIELNPQELKKNGEAAVVTSHASIVTPFCLGSALAVLLYPKLSHQGVSFTSFALFMGSAMSITAFPVLARILTERNLLGTRMGTLSISCAAVDDVTGWCILAYIVILVRAESSSASLWATIGGVIAYIAVMMLGIRRLLPRFESSLKRHGRLTENALAFMITLAMLSALTTEKLGIHSLFGAFFLGAIMPKSAAFTRAVGDKLESLTVVALLPLFFAFSGLRTSLGAVQGQYWIYTLLVIAVAILGKFGGSMFAARLSGISWRDASSLGILMNTRGLMELIALNIGLDIGVISQTMFSMMVVMALVTTFMTSPLLEWIYRPEPVAEDVDFKVPHRIPADQPT
ncbi:MAG TPA: cation:proton antiporter [Bryobacteraceae bacterium]|nr:cation:proton antiporter [Bryobacteraceae bacterium]